MEECFFLTYFLIGGPKREAQKSVNAAIRSVDLSMIQYRDLSGVKCIEQVR
jgi:hypothetical protein